MAQSSGELSSRAKGDLFEAKVFEFLHRAATAGQFIVPLEQCRFYQKKGYFSNDRKSNIVFDISIECFFPGEPDSYFLLLLVECKDYTKRVPVDDAEEFYSKIAQVSASKGMIISSSGFAQGTVTYCKSKRIGLARYFDSSNFKWELLRSPSLSAYETPDWVTIHSGLVDEAHRSSYFDFYSYSGTTYSHSIYTFLRSLVNDTGHEAHLQSAKPQQASVAYIPSERIEALAERILTRVGYTGGAVDLDAICAWQAAEGGLRVRLGVVPDEKGEPDDILGRVTFAPLEIIVFRGPEGVRGRQRFTLAHELGHVCLGHGEHMSGEYCQDNDFDRDGPPGLGIDDVQRMEWQANQFASRLLLPRTPFVLDVLKLVEERNLRDRGHGILFVDEQRCNQDSFYRVTDGLRLKYDVSRSAVEYRLKELGVLNDARPPGMRRAMAPWR
jgi:hypothetical protein